jgi:phosphoenolpyruvate carboxylase
MPNFRVSHIFSAMKLLWASLCLLEATLVSSKKSKVPFVPLGGGGSRIIAKNQEESSDLADVAVPLTQKATLEEDDDPLIEDIELLSNILSEIVQAEDPAAHNLYESLKSFGHVRALDVGNQKPLNEMVDVASKLSADEALAVMRSFSVAINLINSAEVIHRHRMLKQHESRKDASGGPLPLLEDSIRGTMDALLKSGDATPDQIYEQLTRQKAEIVLTAHPTQVQRKSLLRKYRIVSEVMEHLRRPDLDPWQRDNAREDLRRIISSIWGSSEIRRNQPTPQQEAAGGNAVLESVLWDAVPAYLRKLDSQCRLTLNRRLPVDCTPITFASWIGGDRDGNPNVTPEVTMEVVLQQRVRAARLFMNDLYGLLTELTIASRFSPAMEELAASIKNSPHEREKYRRVIGHLIKRLVRTAREYEKKLFVLAPQDMKKTIVDESAEGWEDVEPIRTSEDLLRPLRIMYDSLTDTGFELVADGLLADIIRRLCVFGMGLVPLDIREESTKHTEALDDISRWLGVGSYKEWSETARISWLTTELSNRRPFIRLRYLRELGFDEGTVKTLETFDTASKIPTDSLGAYVISQAKAASDVLAVMLLQSEFGMTVADGNMMRVVPLFETLEDLTNAPKVLATLFSIPSYVGAIKGKQEVMVGYSDSAKDAGRLAACWAQYKSQEEMVEVAKKYGIELTFL